jgi:hypothetical protein
MKIYTNKVRVMRNTIGLGNKEMIGQELEVHTICSHEHTIRVYNKDKSNHFWFNESDVRFLTPAKFKGKSIAIGDYVETGLWEGIVTGFYVLDGMHRIVFEDKKCGTVYFSEENIKAHDITIRTETIEVNGKTYNKEEVESRLSELKEIK